MEGNIQELQDQLTHKDLYTKLELVGKDIENINKGILRLEKTVADQMTNYVTKDQFSPVRNIAYGMTGLILVAVMGAVLSGVIVKTKAENNAIIQTK